MENRKKQARNSLWATCLAIVVFAVAAGAQQSSTAPVTEEHASAPSASAKASAADSTDKVVLRVGSTQVTEGEIDALIPRLGPKAKAIVATQGRGPVGEEYVKMLLLSQRAMNEHLDASPDVRMQLQIQRAETLAQAEYQKMASEVKVTKEEVSQYYTAHSSEFESVLVRQFLIRKRPPGIEDPKQGLTIQEARTTAESIRKALLAGTDIDAVAETYSSISVMLIDSKPRTLRRADMKPALEKATFDVPSGGVSEVVDMPQAFMVVKVFAHQNSELKDVAAEIEAKLQRQKLDAQIDAMKTSAGIWMDEDYFKKSAPPNSAEGTQAAFANPHSHAQ
jgi:hypothetical protein